MDQIWVVRHHARNEDDLLRGALGWLWVLFELYHGSGRQLNRGVIAQESGVHRFLDVLERLSEDVFSGGKISVGDTQVQALVFGGGGGEQSFHVHARSDVRPEQQSLGPLALAKVIRVRQAVVQDFLMGREVVEGEVKTVGGELDGDGATDAGTGTGDDGVAEKRHVSVSEARHVTYWALTK